MEISIQQYESLKKYLESYLIISTYEEAKEKGYTRTYISYLRSVVNRGIKMVVENNIIKDFEEITLDILKQDNVLIPVQILKQILEEK